MKRTKCSVPSRILKYGAYSPRLESEHAIAIDQMFQVWRYKQRLIGIEIRRRKQSDALLEELHPDVMELRERRDAAQFRVDLIYQSIRDRNSMARSHHVPADLEDRLKDAKSVRDECGKAWDAARKTAYADQATKEKLKPISDIAYAEAKAEYATAGNPGDPGATGLPLYWGSILIANESLKKMKSGPPPRHKPWEGDGSMGVQIAGGIEVRNASRCTMFRIIDGDKAKHKILALRVGSSGKGNREPVWIHFPFVAHRPLPDTAKVKWVTVFRTRIGSRYKWEVQFTVTSEVGFGTPSAKDGSVDIEIGWWRRPDGGIDISKWSGSDGVTGAVGISASDMTRWRKTDDLKATGDTDFNTAIEAMAAWRDGHDIPESARHHADWLGSRRDVEPNDKSRERLAREASAWRELLNEWDRPLMPEWFAIEIRSIGKWTSRKRLAGLVARWSAMRFDGDKFIFNAMSEWLRRDRHLYEWEANQRNRSILWRRDHYRCEVADLANRYASARLDDSKWKKLSRSLKKKNDSEPDAMKSFRSNAKIAAVSEFIRFLKERIACECIGGGGESKVRSRTPSDKEIQ